jgi:hypothetical protein
VQPFARRSHGAPTCLSASTCALKEAKRPAGYETRRSRSCEVSSPCLSPPESLSRVAFYPRRTSLRADAQHDETAALDRDVRGGQPVVTEFQKSFARAGHAHAGVFVVFALLAQILADAADLNGIANVLARDGIWAAAILFPAGFFLFISRPRRDAAEPADSARLRRSRRTHRQRYHPRRRPAHRMSWLAFSSADTQGTTSRSLVSSASSTYDNIAWGSTRAVASDPQAEG